MAIVQSIIFILGVSGIKFLTTKTTTMTFDPLMTYHEIRIRFTSDHGGIIMTSGIIKKEVA